MLQFEELKVVNSRYGECLGPILRLWGYLDSGKTCSNCYETEMQSVAIAIAVARCRGWRLKLRKREIVRNAGGEEMEPEEGRSGERGGQQGDYRQPGLWYNRALDTHSISGRVEGQIGLRTY